MASRSDNFNRAAGNLVGSTPSGGGTAWSSPGGDIWSLLNGPTDGQAQLASTSTATAVLDCVSADGDTQVTLKTLAGSPSAGVTFRQSDASNYWKLVVTTSVRLWKVVAGTPSFVGQDLPTLANGDVYKVHHVGSTIQVYQNGTLLTGVGTSGTVTDSFNSTATKHGLFSDQDKVTLFDTWSFADLAAGATTYTCTPSGTTTATVGTAKTFTLQANGSPSPSLVVTPAVSPSDGTFSPTTVTISDALTHAFTWTPGATGSHTLSFTHTGGGFTGSDAASVTVTASASALSAGTASFDSCGPAGGSPFIKMTATDAAGGTPAYTYQWQRATDGGTSSNLTDGGGVSGSTTRTLTDGSAVTGHTYTYKINYTDSASASAASSAVSASVYPGGVLSGTSRPRIVIRRGR